MHIYLSAPVFPTHSPPLYYFFNNPPTTEIYTLSLHDALPIFGRTRPPPARRSGGSPGPGPGRRSEEHTSELQSRRDLVCRLLLEKKKSRLRSKDTPHLTLCTCLSYAPASTVDHSSHFSTRLHH